MRHEYTSDDLFGILHDCQDDQDLCETVIFLSKEHLEAIIDGHFLKVSAGEERSLIHTRFMAKGHVITLSSSTDDLSRSHFRFAKATKKATP